MEEDQNDSNENPKGYSLGIGLRNGIRIEEEEIKETSGQKCSTARSVNGLGKQDGLSDSDDNEGERGMRKSKSQRFIDLNNDFDENE